MKFKISLCYADDVEQKEVFWESYDENVDDPESWAERTVEWFNETLRPHERPRKLLDVVIEDGSNDKFHNWSKDIKGMSAKFRGSFVDFMVCTKCGVTGKRYDLSDNVRIDSKFRNKVFQRCDTAQKEMDKW